MNTFDQKNCPQCSEPIRITAKKCPFCQSWQGRRFSWHNPVVGAIIPALVYLVVVVPMMRSVNKPTHLFNDYRTQVSVTSAEMNYSVENEKNILCTLGEIRNDTAVTWEHIAIEVQYFNRDGKLIDTCSDQDYQLTLAPHTQQAFRVRFEPDKPRSEYASQKVFIRDASDAHRWL